MVKLNAALLATSSGMVMELYMNTCSCSEPDPEYGPEGIYMIDLHHHAYMHKCIYALIID